MSDSPTPQDTASPEAPARPKFSKEGWQRTKQLLHYLAPYRWHFIVGMIFLALGSLVFMVFPIAAGELINIATGKSSYGFTLGELGAVLVVVLVFQAFASYMRVWLFTHISERGLADIRKKLYQKLITQYIPFLEQHRVGELTSRSTSDIQQLQDVFSITLAEFFRQIIILIGGLSVILVTAPRLALLMLLTFPVVIGIALFFGRYIRKLSKERQDEVARTNIILEETLQAISVVKAFNNERFESARYDKSINHVVHISMRFARLRGLFIAFIISVLFGVMFFVLWSGALMVQTGEITEGVLVTFIVNTAMVGGAMASLGDFYTQLLKAISASERIMEILDSDVEIDIHQPKPAKRHLHGNIEFNNVRFRYPSRPDIEILKGLNLQIKQGQKIALVGASGAGKSTIMQLLLRFYALETGTISIDGESIQTMDLSQMRQNMALVPQDVILFGGTIRENILYGKNDASDAEIIEAARKANAWSFIESFPEQLDTVVGERGVKLSGGQRQRIAIARAILKDPSILLLDEATSALDAESEKVVQEALDNLMIGRTSIIIAHRLATIKNVDCIYVLQNGVVVEYGTHHELMHKEGGTYRQLASLQFAEQQLFD